MATGHLIGGVDTRRAGEGIKDATREGLFVRGKKSLTMRPDKLTRPNTNGTEDALGKLTSTEDERALREPESLMPGVYAPGHNHRTMGRFLDPDAEINRTLDAGLPSYVRERKQIDRDRTVQGGEPEIAASPEEKAEMALGLDVIAAVNSVRDHGAEVVDAAQDAGDDEGDYSAAPEAEIEETDAQAAQNADNENAGDGDGNPEGETLAEKGVVTGDTGQNAADGSVYESSVQGGGDGGDEHPNIERPEPDGTSTEPAADAGTPAISEPEGASEQSGVFHKPEQS